MLCHDLRFSCSRPLSLSMIQERRHPAAQPLPANRIAGVHVALRFYWPVSLAIGMLVAICVSLPDGSRVRAEEPGVRDVQLDAISGQFLFDVRVPEGTVTKLVELQPYLSDMQFDEGLEVAELGGESKQHIRLPRWDGDRDRLDSRFVLIVNGRPAGDARYPTSLDTISRDSAPFPERTSKKGLQVQEIDDALKLGIQHASLNVDLGRLVDPRGRRGSLTFESRGETFHFHRRAVEGLDQQVKTLSDAGVLVYLILLNYVHSDEQVDAVMRHPKSPRRPKNNISAFNIVTERGTAWFRATVEFLATRYAISGGPNGQAVGFIVGNEVNSHSYWHAQGPADPATVIEQYHRMLRVVHAAVRRTSQSARVYISLDHFWGQGMSEDPRETFGGKELFDGLIQLSHAGGDFDWHVAHHPYPENLFEPRAWLDRSPRDTPDTPRITFKNLPQLTKYLEQPEHRYQGQIRRVILSEQGFHSPDTPEGELHQAAGFCYAWVQVERLPGIDAFILHRHVDHAHEGGLNLGLWTRAPDSIATPAEPKMLYDIFRVADTDSWEEAFEFALPVIGIESWDEL